jgi:hypothetical protein
MGVRTVLHGAAEDTGKKLGRLIGSAHEFAAFMKHADKDPTGVIENFVEANADHILFVACHDFIRVAKGQPVELQVYEAWWFATAYANVSDAPLRSQEVIRRCIRAFPGIRRADRKTRAELGLLHWKKRGSIQGCSWILNVRCGCPLMIFERMKEAAN